MNSSSDVIRSLSADELASSLSRRDTAVPVRPVSTSTASPLPETMSKIGPWNRLRRALSLSAPSARSDEHCSPTRTTTRSQLYPDTSSSAASFLGIGTTNATDSSSLAPQQTAQSRATTLRSLPEGVLRGGGYADVIGESDRERDTKLLLELAKTTRTRHHAVEKETAGRVSFSTVFDEISEIYRLEERVRRNVMYMLNNYLGRLENMEALVERLTVILPPSADDDCVQSPSANRVRYHDSYVASMLLRNGPIRHRRSLFSSPKHFDLLIWVLGNGTPTDPVVVRSTCKVLFSVLQDFPEETVLAMARRKDFIDALLSHIAVTGCLELCLSMLSTGICQDELKFERSNKRVVGMMADSKVVMTLCDKLAIAAERAPLDGTSSSMIENCSRLIVGIGLRALVIPRYEINDDDSDASYRTKFNRDLLSLDVFSQPIPILRLLDSGLTALAAHDTRGYALSTALTAIRYLLVTVLNGQVSSSSTIRVQLLTVNTATYEAGIRARIPQLAKVLEHARVGIVVETVWEKVENPLGVVRLKILELLVVLLQHCSEATAKAIARAEIPRILLDLFFRLKFNSLLHHDVASIVQLSFFGTFACLKRAFLIDASLLDQCMELWERSAGNSDDPKQNPVTYTGELLRIVCAVNGLLKHDTLEVQDLKRDIGASKIEVFKGFWEGPVAEKLKENLPLLCGPGTLPLLPMDSISNDGEDLN